MRRACVFVALCAGALVLAAAVPPSRTEAPTSPRLHGEAPLPTLLARALDTPRAPLTFDLPGEGASASSSSPSLDGALTADGQIAPGVRGSFSAEGYRLTLGADGRPRFTPTRAGAETPGASSPRTGGAFSGAFRNGLPNGPVLAVAVISPTEFVIGGEFRSLGGLPGTDHVARWDGSQWQALGGGVQSRVRTLAVSGSDVYVGGDFSQAYATPGMPVTPSTDGVAGTHHVAKWTGTAWQALGGGVSHPVYALALSGSDVYVGGAFSQAYASAGAAGSTGTDGVAGTHHVAKWTGTAWQALGGGVNHFVYALALSGSDVYVGGQFTSAYATAGGAGAAGTGSVAGTYGVARWTGTAWQALGAGVQGSVRALAVSGSDVYVGGFFSQAYARASTAFNSYGVAGTHHVARWDGTAWQALGGGVQGSVRALAVTGSDVYVGGFFSQAYATAGAAGSAGTGSVAGTYGVARWTGTAWQALGAGVQGSVRALAVSGSDVYVGGDFSQAHATVGAAGTVGSDGVAGTSGIARWDGAAWKPVRSAGIAPWVVNALAVLSSGEFVVGGEFRDLGGVPGADYVARWDGSQWQALGGGTCGPVHALSVSGAQVYVGGAFTQAYAAADTPTSGVAGTRHVARWDGSAWHALGGGVDADVRPAVYALALSGSDVYVGGQFTSAYATAGAAGSTGTDGVAGTHHVAKWTGTAWQALGGGVQKWVMAIAVRGSDVYVGGFFSQAYASAGAAGSTGTDGVAGTHHVAKWTGTAWQALGGGVSSSVYALALSASDVYAGGGFSQANATAGAAGSTGTDGVAGTSGIARWDGTAWHALGGGVDSGVRTLAVSGRNVYAGGYFTSAYATAGAAGSAGTDSVAGTHRVARWTGTVWEPLAGGIKGNVYTLAIGQAPRASSSETTPSGIPVPALLVGGLFAGTGDGTPASNLTYYTETSTSLPADGRGVSTGGVSLVVLSNASAVPVVRLVGASSADASASVEVIDVLGRVVRREAVALSGGTSAEVALGGVASGVYVVRASAGGHVTTAPLVVR